MAFVLTLSPVAQMYAVDTNLDGVFDRLVPPDGEGFDALVAAANGSIYGPGERRYALEFDLNGLPRTATVFSAVLNLWNISAQGGGSYELHGYAGSGTVTLNDVAVSHRIAGPFTVAGFYPVDLRDYLTAQRNAGTRYLGISVRNVSGEGGIGDSLPPGQCWALTITYESFTRPRGPAVAPVRQSAGGVDTGIGSQAPAFGFGAILLAGPSTPIPGKGTPFKFVSNPALGRGPFGATFWGSDGSSQGIYQADDKASLHVVVDDTTPLPDLSGRFNEFATFQPLSVSGGDVAFEAWGSTGAQGIFVAGGGAVATVALAADLCPSGSRVCVLQRPFLSGDTLAFARARYDVSPAVQDALYLYSGARLKTAVDTSTPIPGGTGTFDGFGQFVLDGGELAFIGRRGVRCNRWASTGPKTARSSASPMSA
jgi:hypothetical protein